MRSATSFFLQYYFKKHIAFLWGDKPTATDRFWKVFYRLKNNGAIQLVSIQQQHLIATADVNNGPVHVQIRVAPSSDIRVYQQVFAEHEYKTLVATMLEYDAQPRLIVDAGANVGYTTLYLLAHFKQSQVICIEPDAANAAQIDANAAANDCNNVEVVKAGVWSHNCWLTLKKDKSNGQEWGFYVTESDTATDLPAIDILQLAAVKNALYIDLLKMDIEGSEAKIFEDPAYATSLLCKTRFIAIEIHDDLANRSYIQQLLLQNGFTWYESGELTIGVNKNLVTN